ncbi:MAG TPA: transposase [Pirellulales bacterium]|nr:transposase [Pirellulales bacterium]
MEPDPIRKPANDPNVKPASRRFRPLDLLEFGYFDPSAPIACFDGNLPHWRQDGVIYFVTFRSADSLPQQKLRLWRSERHEWLLRHPEPLTPDQKSEYWRLFPERAHQWLDAGYGECLLVRPEVRQIVVDALDHFDGARYRLHSWVVMPNHVHAVVSPFAENGLSQILQSWKSFTSKAINKLLARTGTFWQKESFDHLVRSPESLERIDAYILANPASLQPGTFTLSPNLQTRRDAASTLKTPRLL